MHHLSSRNQDAGVLSPTPASFMQPYGCSVALSTLKDTNHFVVFPTSQTELNRVHTSFTLNVVLICLNINHFLFVRRKKLLPYGS